MGIITFKYGNPTKTGVDAAAAASLTARLYQREVASGAVRTISQFEIKLVVGIAAAALSDTSVNQCWVISEGTAIAGAQVFYKKVAGDALFTELIDVDPRTFAPLNPIPPSAADILAEAGEARDDAQGFAGDAAGSAGAAAGSAAAAANTAAGVPVVVAQAVTGQDIPGKATQEVALAVAAQNLAAQVAALLAQIPTTNDPIVQALIDNARSATAYALNRAVTGTPVTDYAWLGAVNASQSIQRVGGVETRRNLSTNPRGISAYGAYGAQTITPNVVPDTQNPDGITTANRVAYAAAASTPGVTIASNLAIGTYAVSAWVFHEIAGAATSGFAVSGVGAGPNIPVNAGAWERQSWITTLTANNGVIGYRANPAPTAAGSFLVTGVLIERIASLLPFFDGATLPRTIREELDSRYAFDSNLRRGTGFPLGVLAAPVGTEYIDLDATNGARKWFKASGTGTSGWVVTDGDTGWRTLPLINGWTGTVNLRRVNETVYLNVVGLAKAASTSGNFAAEPPGFRAGQAWMAWAEEPVNVFLRIQSGALTVSSVTSIRGVTYGTFSWVTTVSDIWPTTLPGTAA